MTTWLIIALLLYLATIIVARLILDKEVSALGVEGKAAYLQVMMSFRKTTLIFTVVLIAAFFVVLQFRDKIHVDFPILMGSYFGLLMLYNGFIINVLVYKKLKKQNFPEKLLKRFIQSAALKLLGMIIVASVLIFEYSNMPK